MEMLTVIFVTALVCNACSATALQSVENLPPYEDIEELTRLYGDSLHVQSSQDRFFPCSRFTHNGSIIGWRFPAAPGIGTQRPTISILRLTSGTMYSRVQQVEVSGCTVRVYTLENGLEVELHESGPIEPISFQEGDILGLHLGRVRQELFDPYLYNSSAVGSSGEHISYILSRGTIRDDTVDISRLTNDTLQPLFGLATCNSSDEDPNSDVYCTGETLFNNLTCIELQPTVGPMNATVGPPTSASVDPPTSTTVGPPLSPEFLAAVIIGPILGVVLLFMACLFITVCICVYSIRASKQRQHSMYNEEVAMEDMNMNGTISTFSELGARDYDTQATVAVKDTTLRDVKNTVYEPRASVEYLQSNDGLVPVSDYEEPVLSQSQESVVHLYDKPRDIVFSSTPPSPFPLTPSPHPHLPSTPSPQLLHLSQNSLGGSNSGYYHSLERPKESVSSLTATRRMANGHSTSSTPKDSPPILHVDRSNEPSVSPEPRYRLKSTPNNTVRATPGAAHDLTQRPESEQGYSSLRTTGRAFKFETGVYVPTKLFSDIPLLKLLAALSGSLKHIEVLVSGNSIVDLALCLLRCQSSVIVKQINKISNKQRDSIFDDSVYTSLGEGTNSPSVNNWTFFEEIDKYWKPATNAATLYQQLASRKYREIIRKQVKVVSHLGSGEFGTVCRGTWSTEQRVLEVAIKMLSSKSSEEATVRFLQEAAIMGQFRHPNIVRLHGVVTVGEPVMIVLELVNNGDLRKYLKSLRSSQLVTSTLPQQLLDFSSQIALGMEYLARKEFVHRDLAARNVLLTDDLVCKIADFGLSRDLEDEDFYVSNGGKIPVKWTAPEAIHYRKYSLGSDVWSFGILLYEIWSMGSSPYKNKSAEETVSLVDSGYRLPPPPGCPKGVYELMIECWHPDAQDRPTFTDLVTSLSQSGESLLRWSQDDLSSHPQVSTLGSQLSLGELLFPELQNMYSS